MRTKIIVVLFTVLLVVGTVFAGGNVDKAEKRAYNSVLYLYGELESGASTSSGNMVHVRGARYLWFMEASDSRLTGYAVSVFNGNLDATGTGPIWGDVYSTDEYGNPIDDGWRFSWQGKIFNEAAGKLNWLVKSVGFGTGIYDGLRVEDTEAFDTTADLSFWPWQGYAVGEISEAE